MVRLLCGSPNRLAFHPDLLDLAERFLGSADLRLCEAELWAKYVFGFPAPGDPYWDEQTLADTQTRYPRADLTPYCDRRVE